MTLVESLSATLRGESRLFLPSCPTWRICAALIKMKPRWISVPAGKGELRLFHSHACFLLSSISFQKSTPKSLSFSFQMSRLAEPLCVCGLEILSNTLLVFNPCSLYLDKNQWICISAVCKCKSFNILHIPIHPFLSAHSHIECI